MKTEKVIAELKELYKKDKNLAAQAAKALGFKILEKKRDNEEQRVVAELKQLHAKDSKLAAQVAKVLGYKIKAVEGSVKTEAKGWGGLPRGWTMDSVKKFWNSLTGDKKHKIGQCLSKMKGKIDNPGAFCGSLAKKVEYSPKLKKGQKGPWWLEKKNEK